MNSGIPPYITLYTESNPNPNSLKFVANFLLVPEGQTFDFPDAESAKDSPLAQEMFQYDFIQRVFIMNNFITLSKDDRHDWRDIAGDLKKHLKEFLEAKKPILKSGLDIENAPAEDEPEINQKIRSILDEYVRPAVEGDGGAISLHSFEDGIVKVLLQGACSGCPSSTMTLKMGIENLLTRMVPEVKEVVAEGV